MLSTIKIFGVGKILKHVFEKNVSLMFHSLKRMFLKEVSFAHQG